MKRRLFNKLMVVMTGVLLGLLFALNNSMSITSYAKPEDKHYEYKYGQYKGYFEIHNEDVMGDIGISSKIKSLTNNSITFTSSNCKSSNAGLPKNRNFVIEKNGTFTISIPEKYRISAVELSVDIDGDVSINGSDKKGFKGIKNEKEEYELFYNNDSMISSLEFKAGSDGFSFEEITVYYYMAPPKYATPPTTLYMGGRFVEPSYQFIDRSKIGDAEIVFCKSQQILNILKLNLIPTPVL